MRSTRSTHIRLSLNPIGKNPDIIRVAKDAFEDGHFDKSVLSAFIEVNDQVKKIVLQKTKKESDGAKLMNMAFSVDSPIIKLTDLLNQAEWDVQIGFMQIFAGSMTGIRNPHAHVNWVIDAKRGRHYLYLASLLMKTLKEARPWSAPRRTRTWRTLEKADTLSTRSPQLSVPSWRPGRSSG